MTSTVDNILKIASQMHGLRILISIAMLILIWRLRQTGTGAAFVENLNNVHLNVWAVVFVIFGVLITIHGKDNVGQVLITSGFAILRGPAPKPVNGVNGAPPPPVPPVIVPPVPPPAPPVP
jgi:hypothetical protein